MADEPGGGGEIFSLFGSVGVDIAPSVQALNELNAAGQRAAEKQSQYSKAVSEAWARLKTTGGGGNQQLQGDLGIVRSVLGTGRSFEQALGALSAMGRSKSEVREFQRTIEQSLGSVSTTAKRTSSSLTGVTEAVIAGRVAARSTTPVTPSVTPAAASRLTGPITEENQVAWARRFARPTGATSAVTEAAIAATVAAKRTPEAEVVNARAAAGGGHGGSGILSAFGLGTGSGALRTGLGLVGLGAGLNVAATLARELHTAIVGAVESQIAWERSLRETRGLYGDMAPQVERIAQAQANLPDVLGTQREFLQANLNARYLTSRYGLPQAEVTQLTTGAGRVAFTQGLDEKERQALQQRVLQFAESGGSGLRDIGIEGDPEAIARRLGQPSGAALQGLTPQQLREAQTLIATEGANRYALQANGPESLLGARSTLEHNLNVAASNLTQAAESSGDFAHQMLVGFQTANFVPGHGYEDEALQQAATKAAYEEAQQAVEANTRALGDAQQAADEAARKLSALGLETGTATTRLLSFTGSLENTGSLARADIGAAAQRTVAQRAVGPNPLIGQTEAEIQVQSRQAGEEQAFQAFVAPQAQRDLAKGTPIHEFLSAQANAEGPGLEGQRGAAQAALADADRRTDLNRQIRQRQQQADRADQLQALARNQVTALDLNLEQRRLGSANELAQAHVAVLSAQSREAPLLLAQASLQDRITVASRENLTIVKQLTEARIAQLGISEQQSATDFRMRRNQAEASGIQSRIIRGTASGTDVERLNVLRADQFKASLDKLDEELPAVVAARPVELAQQAQTRDELGRTKAIIPLTEQQRALEDALMPLAAGQRNAQAVADGLQRSLDAARQMQEPSRTLLAYETLYAQQTKLAADQEERLLTLRLAQVDPALLVPPTPVATVVPAATANGAIALNSTLNIGQVNSVEELDRVARAAADSAYIQWRTQLIQVFNQARPSLPATLSSTPH